MKIFFIILLSAVLAACDSTPEPSNNPALTAPLPDFSDFTDVKAKKRAFFEFLLPLVYEANQRITVERELVKKWQENDNLSDVEQEKIERILTKYRVTTDDRDEQETLILRRVQPLPPSIVLAQAANESAWGTSRFAREGNNLFGQWCFTIGCGIIPGERNHRAKHEVRVFESPFNSVSSYMRNLNSHEQYQDLRIIRQQLLEQEATVTGKALANGLLGYSERGEDYVHEIQQMIRFNKLSQLDANPLGDQENNGN